MKIKRSDLDQAFKKASVNNDIEQSPGRAALEEAGKTGIVAGLTAVLIAAFVDVGNGSLGTVLGLTLMSAIDAYHRQSAAQEAYRDLTTQAREDAPKP